MIAGVQRMAKERGEGQWAREERGSLREPAFPQCPLSFFCPRRTDSHAVRERQARAANQATNLCINMSFALQAGVLFI